MKKVNITVSLFSIVHFLVECAKKSSYSQFPVYVKVEKSQVPLPVSRVYLERNNIVVVQYQKKGNPMEWETFLVHLLKYPTIDTFLFKESHTPKGKYSTFLLSSPISLSNNSIIINISPLESF